MGILPDQELLINLRKELHKLPELSGNEEITSRRVMEFLKELRPDELINHLGGHGVAARFRGKVSGPRVMIRSELDALPINESNDFEHKSASPGVSHKCGHDGHMAIAAGVARLFSQQRHERGELVVLFQPSEENGQGACEVLNDPVFATMEPDYILAMHNLPGFSRHEIILREGVFAAASEGMVINLRGKTSHAGQPHNGISPSAAVSQILRELPHLSHSKDFHDFTLITIIHARIGEIAFGTSPGDAVVMATLRAYEQEDMEMLKTRATGLVENIALREKLGVSVSWTERFPTTANDPFMTFIAGEVAGRIGYNVRHIEHPFRWSEDFGWFTRSHRGMLFGIGAGLGHPELHNPDYDFPDELISTGVDMIGGICRVLLK